MRLRRLVRVLVHMVSRCTARTKHLHLRAQDKQLHWLGQCSRARRDIALVLLERDEAKATLTTLPKLAGQKKSRDGLALVLDHADRRSIPEHQVAVVDRALAERRRLHHAMHWARGADPHQLEQHAAVELRSRIAVARAARCDANLHRR